MNANSSTKRRLPSRSLIRPNAALLYFNVDNVREHRTQVSVFPLLSLDLGGEDVERYYFQLEGGRLTHYWREGGTDPWHA